MLKPVGFWSYTKASDANARGRITQLRGLLEAELQQRIGRATEMLIFQDVEGIQLGNDWEQRIRTALDTATFFIPIITPSFLRSEWCCRETMLFREREKALGHDDLIFPIHFVSVDHINAANPAPDECHDPQVLPFLRTRQWLDYRPLRQLDPDSTQIAMLLERLADAIFNAVRSGNTRAAPPPPPPPPPAPPPAPVAQAAFVRAVPAVAPPIAQQAVPAAGAPGNAGPSAIVLVSVIGLAAILGIGGVWYYVHARGAAAGGAADVSAPAAVAGPQTITAPSAGVAAEPTAADDYNAGRYADAFKKYLYAAEHNDSGAQYQIGYMYQTGQGAAFSQASALDWYKKAAAADNALAQARLGYMYQFGNGVAQSYAEAAHWYALAAEHGQKDAQSNLGYLYLHGLGVRRDPAEAEHWLLLAAQQFAPGAQQQLGLMYEQGLVRRANMAEAIRWYSAAAASQYPAAMYRLGVLAAEGKGMPRSLDTARDWMQKAAKAGSMDARQWLQSHG